MSRKDREPEDGYMEFQLDGRQMMIVMVGIVILCAISFYFGKRVGRAQTVGEGGELAPLVVENGLQEEDAGEGLTFFDTVGEERPADPSWVPVETAAENAAKALEAGGTTSVAKPPAATETASKSPAPPAVSKPAARKAAPAPSTSAVQVQVVALSSREAADSLARRLESKGYRSPNVSTTLSGGRTLYRVRLGGFASRADAEAAVARLKREEKLDARIAPMG